MLEQIKEKLATIKAHPAVTPLTLRKAHALYVNGQCRLLTCARDHFHIAIDDEFKDFDLTIEFKEDVVTTRCRCKAPHAECHHAVAGLLELADFLQRDEIPILGMGMVEGRWKHKGTRGSVPSSPGIFRLISFT